MNPIGELKLKPPSQEVHAPAQVWRFRNALQWTVAWLGFDLIILLVMTTLLAYLVRRVGSQIRWFHPSLALPVGMMLGVLAVDFFKWAYFLLIHKTNRAFTFLRQIPLIFRDWAPFLLIDFIYENLHDLSGNITSFDIAPLLYRFDLFLFGFEPTLLCQKITTPFLTDIMAILYAPYLAYPLILMALFSLSSRRSEFKKISMGLILTFLIGFICYVVFPALPPRYFLMDAYTNPVSLNGSFIHDHLQGVWDQLSMVRGAAFPSLHVAISSIALYYAFHFRKISKVYFSVFCAYMILVPGLWFSTIYLRHHWVGDIIAGWFVATLAIALTEKLLFIQSRYHQRFNPMGVF